MIDYAALKTELTTDPKTLGYASQLGLSDIAVAAMLNATTGNGAATISISSMTRGEWDAQLIPMEDQVTTGLNLSGAALSAAVISKWNSRIAAFRAGDPSISVAVMTPLLNSAVSDGLITSSFITQITSRTGSRAEVLFGEGTVIDHNDISKAMGNWLK